MPGTIRPALPHEGIALTDLVIRSKAYWGYDSAFLAASRPALTLTARRIAEDVVYVYQDGQQALGVYDLRIVATRGDVDLFFVAPAAIRTGVGRALWQHLVDQARHRGVRRLMIESDGAYILSLTGRFAGCRGPVLVAMRSPKRGFPVMGRCVTFVPTDASAGLPPVKLSM